MVMRVNVSAAQLASHNIVASVADHLREYELPPECLCLEITESAVMHDTDRAIAVLDELVALGVHLAIDDFGTGFSSMTQLKRMPVSVLKLDRTFVIGLGTDAGDTAIIDSMIKLAEAFGLDVVAEGVEETALVGELLRHGCFRAQGFLFCRPQPPEDLTEILVRGGIDPAILGISDSQIPDYVPDSDGRWSPLPAL
jgi:EAL domain-containing protein (putative c-di-GMP-specific phosphodiesterase class I)